MRLVLSSVVLACLSALPAKASEIVLVPHRAVYELSLQRVNGARGVDAVAGRIVFEITGGQCEGYVTNFRQVMEMSGSEIGQRLTDVRVSRFEDADGRSMRYLVDRHANGQQQQSSEGSAVIKHGAVKVTVRKPKTLDNTLPGDVIFPNEWTLRLIKAARAGETTVSAQFFDGSDQGDTLYSTLAVIGRPIAQDAVLADKDGKPADLLKGMVRWPMSISYFKAGEQTPAYKVNLEMFDNGVSRNLVLDYGSLVLKGELSRIEFQKSPKC
jgi:hypothetical protein